MLEPGYRVIEREYMLEEEVVGTGAGNSLQRAVVSGLCIPASMKGNSEVEVCKVGRIGVEDGARRVCVARRGRSEEWPAVVQEESELDDELEESILRLGDHARWVVGLVAVGC